MEQLQALLPAGAAADPARLQRFREAVSELLFWRLVRLTIVDTDQDNAAVLRLRGFQWRDANGVMHPVLVFRSAINRIDPDAPSCVRSLLSDGGACAMWSICTPPTASRSAPCCSGSRPWHDPAGPPIWPPEGGAARWSLARDLASAAGGPRSRSGRDGVPGPVDPRADLRPWRSAAPGAYRPSGISPCTAALACIAAAC